MSFAVLAIRRTSTFSYCEIGILKLELGKERYEKTGLTGKPVRSGGRKHVKERFGL
jgi:ribonuclease P/MRP protein subunit RPP40